ncbi:hypothetical protein SGRA_1354 [Saprospira grandis str. Lewin]|uniref:Uncharacterized protein n=1 Tax=Saprospira grandis (strain Lewin) TaxID=984262 RepID=H6L6E7_SAPGL|nr:hypothetical protein SGRA_1354 [Saprospira grandis str. Lewin]
MQGRRPAKERSDAAEGWTAVAEGQTQAALLPQGRANSELRHSPTQGRRPQGQPQQKIKR